MKTILKTVYISLILAFLCAQTNAIACSCINDFKRIKSFEDLNTYEFVALVKVTSETINPPSDLTPFRDAALRFKIVEKFKGKDLGELIEKDVESSCDMGIEVGDEWVLFATFYDGKLSIAACNRDIRYRDKDGVRDWPSTTGNTNEASRNWKI